DLAIDSAARLMAFNAKAFTPSRDDPRALDERTVGRTNVLDTVVGALGRAATTGNRPHILLVGPRGAGKSHVTEVALHRVGDHDDQLVVARLPEDAVGLTTAADVMFAVLSGIAPDIARTDACRAARRDGDVVALGATITAATAGRTLVVVIENLDRIFEAIGANGQSELRGWVDRSAEVTVLASAPLLFHAVQSRQSPWFGAFEIIHLEPLTLAQGTELVATTARQAGNTQLAAVVRTPRAQSRLAAVHALAGGSPRIWTIFASCLEVDHLDELVPVAEALLEELVPYYQQRLWELPPVGQKLIVELAGDESSLTVTDLADRAGLARDSAAVSLSRLAEAGWVRSRKVAGTDRRQSWYELSEPLLRHHLQYRNDRGKRLRLIVDLLCAWFDVGERRRLYLTAPDGRVSTSYLAESLANDPGRQYDSAYARRDIDELTAEARLWEAGLADDAIGSPALGTIVLELIGRCATDLSPGDRQAELGRLLDDASVNARGTEGDTAASVELIAACWNGYLDPGRAAHRLRVLANQPLRTSLRLAVRSELAGWLGESG
ncbi:MAG: AAA family ATPase, partial [Desertimonas sp.]